MNRDLLSSSEDHLGLALLQASLPFFWAVLPHCFAADLRLWDGGFRSEAIVEVIAGYECFFFGRGWCRRRWWGGGG